MNNCPRCDVCQTMSHHWIAAPSPIADYECKHCPALGEECMGCDGKGCAACDCEGCKPVGRLEARHAYFAYGESVQWRNFRGDDMPDFSQLPDAIQKAWQAAAVAAVRYWAEVDFRAALADDARIVEWGLGVLKVAVDKGDPPIDGLRKSIGSFVISLIEPELFQQEKDPDGSQ